MKQLKLWVFFLMVFSIQARGNDTLQIDNAQYSDEELAAMYQHLMDSIEATFSYDYGTITLKNGLATIIVPEGFKYLNGKESDRVLTEIWGNPPTPDEPSLGMFFPENASPVSDSSYAINITYTEDGYINDDDAKDIDYDDLENTMKESFAEGNKIRKEQGYPTMDFVGWASTPFYDEANKKLHWAKELKFEGSPVNTLNYNIRILGRKGYLELNAIGEMPMLGEIKNSIDPILGSVNFNDGNKYSDFNPDIDKVAAYGIGGLIAGKLLAKAGLLAKIGIILAKFWKIIALAFIGFFAGIKKFFGKKEEPTET